MIDKELELYYRNIRDMFGTDGWKQLMEDLKSNAMVINSVEAAKDNEDLHFRKGQLSIIANLLNLEAQIDAAEEQAMQRRRRSRSCLMRAIYEYRCEDGHTNERYTDSECTHIPCLDCDKIARRIVSAVRSKLDPLSGDFMGATRQWEKNRAQKLQQERKANS